MKSQPEILIIGAGLSGLCCARRLHQCDHSFLILEASDAVGGRIRTDSVDGFLLDRGFQIYLTAYPEGKRVLDLEELHPCRFRRGALIWHQGRFHRMIDPRSEPFAAFNSLFNPIGSFRDKWRLFRLLSEITSGSETDDFEKEERLTLDLLRWNGGFSEQMIDRFFRPFFGGVFLERKLMTSSRFFRFVLRNFATGEAIVPAQGMQAIPQQIAQRLPQDSIRLNTKVERIERDTVYLTNGESLQAKVIVIATEGPEAARLSGGQIPIPESNSVTCLYYTSKEAPVQEPILLLNGENRGIVNNVAVMSQVSSTYAPAGQHLISVSVLGIPSISNEELDQQVRQQLNNWFGYQVSAWRLLRTYRIVHALPNQVAGKLVLPTRSVRLHPGLYMCGDHRDNASINGSMVSGFRTAQTIMEDLHRKK